MFVRASFSTKLYCNTRILTGQCAQFHKPTSSPKAEANRLLKKDGDIYNNSTLVYTHGRNIHHGYFLDILLFSVFHLNND